MSTAEARRLLAKVEKVRRALIEVAVSVEKRTRPR
jgi:hypothetical protein